MNGTARELATITGGTLSGKGGLRFSSVSTDSRNVRPGELFIALKGERFDGHRFVNDVLDAGAAGVVVDRADCVASRHRGSRFCITVGDTRKALGDAARAWRRAVGPLVIGVTGSCGKTTTKELLHAVISRTRGTAKNHANFNNYYGVAKTLLGLLGERVAVVEMGISLAGEMQELLGMAEPDLGIVTNIAPVHLEGLSGMGEIYDEKRMLLDAARQAVFVNLDDRWLARYPARRRRKRITFGRGGDVSMRAIRCRGFAGFDIAVMARADRTVHELSFPYPGTGASSGVLAACAVARYLDVSWDDIAAGVSAVKLPGLRMEQVAWKGADVVLDAYNANPRTVKGALEMLATAPGRRRIAVLGDMRELGRWSAYYHVLAARWVQAAGLDAALLVGPEMRRTYDRLEPLMGRAVRYAATADEAASIFDRLVRPGDAVLVKGSRSVGLERVVGGGHHAV